MTATLKSLFRAATLSLVLAFGMTTGQAIFKPDTSQAGIISGVDEMSADLMWIENFR